MMLYEIKTEISVTESWKGYGTEGGVDRDRPRRVRPMTQTVGRLSEHLKVLNTFIFKIIGRFFSKWRDRRGSHHQWIDIKGNSIVVYARLDNSSQPLDEWDTDYESWQQEEFSFTIQVKKNGRFTPLPKNLLEESVKYFKNDRQLRLD